MKYYSMPETRLSRVLFCAFLSALLYLSRDSMLCTAMLGLLPSQALTMAVLGAMSAAFFLYHRKDWKQILLDKRVLMMGLVSVIFLLPMFVKADWQLMYATILLGSLVGIFLTYFVSLKTLSRYFVCIVTVIAAFSVLATYLLRISADRGILVPPIFENILGHRFYNYGVSYVSIKYVKTRNFGIFREPGVYQYFLIMGLYLNNYMLDWDKPWKSWTINSILAVTMLTTFATGGIVEMALLVLLLFFQKGYYRSWKCGLALACSVLIAVAIAVWMFFQGGALHNTIRYMVSKLLHWSPSQNTRVEAIFANLKLFLSAPLFGTTVVEMVEVVKDNTSSSTILLAILGLPGTCIHGLGWLALVWNREQKWIVNVLLLVILAASFNTNSLITNLFFWIFPTMAMVEWLLPRWQKT